MLVLLRTMVQVKRRVGIVIFRSRKVAARLMECVVVVEFARLEQPTIKTFKATGRSRVIGCSDVTSYDYWCSEKS